MAHYIDSDQCYQVDKHASQMSTTNGSDSSTSITGITASSDSLFIHGFTTSRRLSSVDTSALPRVHNVRRPSDVLSRKESQPDLIHSHPQLSEISSQSPSLSFEQSHPFSNGKCLKVTNVRKNIVPPTTIFEKLHLKCKLNAPGKSLVVNYEDLSNHPVPEPPPVVTADKLRPYSPSLITVVKEGPSHEAFPVFPSNSEQELTLLQDLGNQVEAALMAPEQPSLDSKCIGAIDTIQDCNCRVVLEDHLLSSLSKCLELQNQMEETGANCARWEGEAGNLRARVQELEMDLGTRTASLHGLKAKVAELYVQIAEVAEQRRRAERDAKAFQSQLDSLSKSELWYREKLHGTQVERSALEKELMSARQEAEGHRRHCDRQAAELRRLQEELRDTAARALRDKQTFARQLEMALAKQGPDASLSAESEDSHVVAELRQVVSDLQVSLKSSSERLLGATGETDRLLRRCMQLQQELCDVRVQLQMQQEAREAAEMDRDTARANLKEREEALAQLSSENARLSVQLECALREHEGVAEAMNTLNRNFTNVSNNWRAMRAEKKALSDELQAAREAARTLSSERDALVERVEDAERREQAARRKLGELESASARASRLEHEVLALRESLDRARTDAACLEAAQRSAVVLEQTVADLERRNEHLRAQVEGLSNLLQENTGSKIEDRQQLQQRARQDQLQVENSHLQQQLERSASRLGELSNTIESLETEMKEARRYGEDAARLSLQLEEANARLSAQAGELQQLRDEKASLQRSKLELTERAEQLASWLQAVTDGAELAHRYEARQRLDRLSKTPVVMESAGGGEGGLDAQHGGESDLSGGGDTLVDQLQAFREANSELAQHADALQRRLEAVPDSYQARPDLLQSSPGSAESEARTADLRCLQALLRVCLYRVRGLGLPSAVTGDALLELSLGGAASETERLVRTLAALGSHVDSALVAAGAAEPDMLQAGPTRRDQMVRALLAHLEEHAKARKEAEDRLALLQAASVGHGDGDSSSLHARVACLEQELTAARSNVKELHKQLFAEKRECLQLRKEVSSLRVGLDNANDMLDNNKIALGRSESYSQVLMISKEQVEERLEAEQREHEECRARLEQLTTELQEARAKDPVLEAQIKTLGCHLHQRTMEVRALQDRLELRDRECEELRAQLERQRASARREYEGLLAELHRARLDFSQILCEMKDAVPKPKPCDEEGLTALIQQSNQLSPLVLDDLKNLLHNLKADLAAVDKQTSAFLDNHCTVVQNV